MKIPTLPGITAKSITSSRLTTRVLFAGADDGTPVLFLHGNTSSATWWEEVLISLPPGFQGIAPDQRGFGEADPAALIDATRGTGDFADDTFALLDMLGIERVHLVGNSMGGSVIWRMLCDQPQRILSAVQVDPGSPYGFGGTKSADGQPCYPDFAGSGGGLANPELIRRLKEGDLSLESQFSPRAVLRTLIVKAPFIPRREDELVMSMCSMHIGAGQNPGDAVRSTNWPFVAPGVHGAANALSPKYTGDVACLYRIQPKPPILWLRGANDLLVSDQAASDPATVGMMGLLPGWPGLEIYPPQPMLAQTRAVLEKYQTSGGSYREVIIPDAGHAPYLDRLEEFNCHLHAHLQA